MKTIGEFYKEKILSLPENSLTTRQLPNNSGGIRIERDLFSWKLYYTKLGRKTQNFMECRSEEEARYIKVFLDSDLKSEIFVPKDDEYLKSILPELERLKKRIDEIIDSSLESVLNRKIRQRVRHEVFMEITKEVYIANREEGWEWEEEEEEVT